MMAPMHFHWFKSEDIINRGGGTLLIKVYNDDGKGGLADSDVLINSDGRSYYVKAGSLVKLLPGESITIWPHQYHEFHVEPGSGSVLIGEVSQCNDDNIDNRFYEDIGRFPEIEEDEEPYFMVKLEQELSLDSNEIFEWVERFEKLAMEFSGDYIGWECDNLIDDRSALN